MRELKYSQALDEATCLAMERDPSVFVMGVGVDDPKGIFGTTLGAFKKFGGGRVFDTPLAENGLTGFAIGAAIEGMRPILVHARNDFLLLTMDQLLNHAAKWKYMCGGKLSVPLTVRAIIGRGWGQAAQHSQSLQSLFMHVPGLKLAMPSTPYDAKGLLIAAIEDEAPVVVLEHRWLYDRTGPVPEGYYRVPLGQAAVVREGTDVTVVAISHMVVESLKAAESLQLEGIDAEIIDPRTLAPLDHTTILASVRKTGRLVIADHAWKSCGAGAEIAALAAEQALETLKAPVRRVTLPDTPTPCAAPLEKLYYPGPAQIAAAVRELVFGMRGDLAGSAAHVVGTRKEPEREFKGPF
jgi:pyruvate dehydrogenase E1 component beta subunit